MFVNDRIVFVELHKTGGTHIGKWLKRLVGGEQIGKHNRVPKHLRDRFIIGSVRDPWDWYVSLWAYGCAGKGSVHRQTTRGLDLNYVWRQLGPEMGQPRPSVTDAARQCVGDLRKPVALWSSVYRDVTDVSAFRQWLGMMLDPARRLDMGEGYGFSPISNWSGLMTYRYLKLFSGLGDALYRDPALATFEGAIEAWRANQLVSFVIRNESLEDDLLEVLEKTGFDIPPEETNLLSAGKKERTNASTREPVDYYYDAATVSLVARHEALIIEAHGYAPPNLGI